MAAALAIKTHSQGRLRRVHCFCVFVSLLPFASVRRLAAIKYAQTEALPTELTRICLQLLTLHVYWSTAE